MPIINRAGSTGPTWSVAYEVDFTALSSAGFGGNGTPASIGGKTWTVQHATDGGGASFCTSLGLVSGTGLQIEFSSPGLTDSYQDPGLNYAPRVEIPVSDLVPGVVDGDVLAFQVLIGSSGLNDDWQFYGLMLGTGPTGNDWIENSTVHWTGGGASLGSDVHMGVGGRALVRIASEIGQRELVWYASSVSGASGFIAGGDSSGAFVDPLTGGHLGVDLRGESAPAIAVTTANAMLSLHAYYNDAASGTPSHSFTATWKKLRVLKMD